MDGSYPLVSRCTGICITLRRNTFSAQRFDLLGNLQDVPPLWYRKQTWTGERRRSRFDSGTAGDNAHGSLPRQRLRWP